MQYPCPTVDIGDAFPYTCVNLTTQFQGSDSISEGFNIQQPVELEGSHKPWAASHQDHLAPTLHNLMALILRETGELAR